MINFKISNLKIRLLKNLPKNIPTIGLAFKFQLTKRIKPLSWDVPVTRVITA